MLTVRLVLASVYVDLPIPLLGVHTQIAGIAVDVLAGQAIYGRLTMVRSLAT